MKNRTDERKNSKGFIEVILHAIYDKQFDVANELITKRRFLGAGGVIRLVDVFPLIEQFPRTLSEMSPRGKEFKLSTDYYQQVYRKVIDLLIEAQADIDAQNDLGETALGLAIKLQDESVVQLLLKKGANPHYVRKDGNTALHIANNSAKLLHTQQPNVNIIQMLLDAKTDVSQANQQGETPITLALRDKNRTEEIINIQIAAYNNKIKSFNETVDEAILFNPDLINIIRLYVGLTYLKPFKNSPLKDQQQVYEAVKKYDVQALKRLIRQGVNTDDIEGIYDKRWGTICTSLELAAKEWNSLEREGLLEKRRSILEVVSMLLNHNHRRQALGTEAYDVAAGLGALLYALPGSVSFESFQFGLDLFALFINYPTINLNHQYPDDLDRTALMQAVTLFWRDEDINTNPIVDLLLDYKPKPDLDIQDGKGNTAVMLVAKEFSPWGGRPDYVYHLIEQLVKNKANINIQNHQGKTALMLLTSSGHTACVELLLKNNADPSLRDNWGENALEIAKRFRERRIDQLLRSYASQSSPLKDQQQVYEAVKENDLLALKMLMDQGVDTDDIKDIYDKRWGKTRTSLELAVKEWNSLEKEDILEKGRSILGVVSMLLNHNRRRQALGTEADDVAAGLGALLCALTSSVPFKNLQFGLDLFALFINYPTINLNHQYQDDRTALMQAVTLFWRDEDIDTNPIVDSLLDYKPKPDLDIQDGEGNTAVMLVAEEFRRWGGRPDYVYHLIEQLVKNKANINIQNHQGKTALMLLTSGGHTECVELLLKNNADPSLRNDRGENALEIAERLREGEIAKLLRPYASSLSLADEKDQGSSPTTEKAQGSHVSVIDMLCNASEGPGSAIPAKMPEDLSKNNQAPEKVYETGENKPPTNQKITPLAGSGGVALMPTNGLLPSSMFQNNNGKKDSEIQPNNTNVSDKPSSPFTPSKAK